MELTTNFPNFLDKTIKKVFTEYSEIAEKSALYAKWMRMAPTTEYDQSFTSDEGIDGFAPLEESGGIKDLSRGVGYKNSISSAEYAGRLTITKKMRIRSKDSTVKLGELLSKDMSKQIGKARLHKELRSHAMLNNGFVTTGLTDPGNGIVLAPDTLSLFNASHAWNSTSETFSNTGTAAFTGAVWDAVLKVGTDITDASGTPYVSIYDTLVVKQNSETARRMKRLFFGNVVPTSMVVTDASTNINLYQGTSISIVETPYLTSETAWFAYDSKQTNPFFLHDVQKPTVEDRIVRENLDWVYPVTISYEVACDEMPTAWYGNTGTT